MDDVHTKWMVHTREVDPDHPKLMYIQTFTDMIIPSITY